MKFLSFFLITFFIIINISVKLLVVDQEAEMKNINKEISEIDLKIEKKTNRYFLLHKTTNT